LCFFYGQKKNGIIIFELMVINLVVFLKMRFFFERNGSDGRLGVSIGYLLPICISNFSELLPQLRAEFDAKMV
jgi:hypothetical protein